MIELNLLCVWINMTITGSDNLLRIIICSQLCHFLLLGGCKGSVVSDVAFSSCTNKLAALT